MTTLIRQIMERIGEEDGNDDDDDDKSSKQFSNLRIYQIKLLRFVLLSYYSLYFFISSFVMVNKGLKKNKTMDCNFFKIF